MQSNIRKAPRHLALGVQDDTQDTANLLSTSCLTFYNTPPVRECTLPEFEQSAFDRLQVLKHIDNARARRSIAPKANQSQPGGDDLRSVLMKARLWGDSDRDILSHYVLRLAYCRSEETRRWLIGMECALFKWRFETETRDEVIEKFLRDNNLNYKQIEENLHLDHELFRKLRDVPGADTMANPIHTSTIFYRIPFEEAFDLVRERRVYLQGGYAYISRSNLVHIVVNKYRTALSLHLASTFRFLQSSSSAVTSDERVGPLLSSLAKQSLGPQYKAVSIEGQVTKEQLPSLASSQAFPLCMSTLYSHLKSEHHLKHGGRMQLGLFLKAIGLSLQDALLFWKQSFSRRTPADKFDKEYAYNIRHNYGKEGKRVTYTAYGCMKIIQSQPGPGDYHGCPFRHDKQEDLKSVLHGRGIGRDGVEEVMRLVKSGDYQVACTRVFALSHGGVEPLMPISHPNKYFDESKKLTSGERKQNESSKSDIMKTQPVIGTAGLPTNIVIGSGEQTMSVSQPTAIVIGSTGGTDDSEVSRTGVGVSIDAVMEEEKVVIESNAQKTVSDEASMVD